MFVAALLGVLGLSAAVALDVRDDSVSFMQGSIQPRSDTKAFQKMLHKQKQSDLPWQHEETWEDRMPGKKKSSSIQLLSEVTSHPSFARIVFEVCSDPWYDTVKKTEVDEGQTAYKPLRPADACEEKAMPELLCAAFNRHEDTQLAETAMCEADGSAPEFQVPTVRADGPSGDWRAVSKQLQLDLQSNEALFTDRLKKLLPKTVSALEKLNLKTRMKIDFASLLRTKVSSTRLFKGLVEKTCLKAGLPLSGKIVHDDGTIFVPVSPCEKTVAANVYCQSIKLYSKRDVVECTGLVPDPEMPPLPYNLGKAVDNVLYEVQSIAEEVETANAPPASP